MLIRHERFDAIEESGAEREAEEVIEALCDIHIRRAHGDMLIDRPTAQIVAQPGISGAIRIAMNVFSQYPHWYCAVNCTELSTA